MTLETLRLNAERSERYQANLTPQALEFLANRGITETIALKYRLGVSDDVQQGWLSIPYLRPKGVLWFNYRRLDDGKPKYCSPGAKHLYNTAALDLADQSGDIAICEGELDTIVATELFGVPAVGIPGATQWDGNPHWHELFRGYRRIWVLADPDTAGNGLAESVLARLPTARLVKLPADVNDCWLQGYDIKGSMK